jgi:hypothetical protein
MDVKGRIVNILEIESGTSKAGKEWKKQGFVMDTGDQYNPNVCFSLFGDDKIAMLSSYSVGEEVSVSFNLSSREYNGKWYHNVDAWKIEKMADSSSANQLEPNPKPNDFDPDTDGDIVPF